VRHLTDNTPEESKIQNPKSKIRRGFTLTEILVAIGIIVLLVGITLRVVSKVRISAQRADVQQQLSSIAAAIERYHTDFRGYPGPLSNDQITPEDNQNAPMIFLPDGTTELEHTDKITMAENLVLGLLGGLRRLPPTGAASTTENVIVYDFAAVGQGPGQLNPKQPKKFSPYAEPLNLSWSDNQPSGGGPNGVKDVPGIVSGYYVDDASLSRATDRYDSPIPEFVDRFTNAMPILYLRARPAAPGVISDDVTTAPGVNYQYDMNQYLGYTRVTNNQTIGVGKDISRGDYVSGAGGQAKTPPPAGQLPHGISAPIDQLKSLDKSSPNYVYPYNAFPYFQDPTIRPTDPAQPNATGTPRKKNGYILISAGPDRVYGTFDDITNFGDVAP
jgi:prepilin-type N-terminal cleavage/methylation domain-containing protein